MRLIDHYNKTVVSCNEATDSIKNYIELMPFGKRKSTAKSFAYFLNSRMQSTLCLLREGYPWDAEIILRSIAEATLKHAFIFLNHEKTDCRIKEFWDDWSEINSLQQSSRATFLIDYISQDNSLRDNIIPLILTKQKETDIRDKWPRGKIKNLKNEWSYGNILKSFSNEKKMSSIYGLMFNYGMSSHLLHADESGIGSEIDRTNRTAEEQQIAHELHSTRILNDLYSFIIFFKYVTEKSSTK